MNNRLKIAILGLGNRGSGLLHSYLINQKDIEITFICDNYQDRAENARESIIKIKGDTPVATTNYKEVLTSDNVDAVIVATSWETHMQVSIDAMRAGKTVGMEVGGAYTLQECWDLVKAYEETKTPFMFLENCCYNKDELLALKMARAGIFGDIVHCSGAYSHDLREEIAYGKEKRHYRLDNYLKRNSENYPTHELGPIAKVLDINRGNRMVSLVSMASRAAGMEQYVKDNSDKLSKELASKKFNQGDIVDTLIKCANGETIRLKLDTTLPGYYDREFTVKGTKGMYMQTVNMAVIDGIDNKTEYWEPKETVEKNFDNARRYDDLLPDVWKNMTEEDEKTGHGGMDGIMLRQFINHAKSGEEMPIDVYDAASWMAITVLSEESINLGSQLVAIPDFTAGKWIKRVPKDVF